MREQSEAILFACIEKNIGDDLFVKLVCERYPNTQFVITADAEYGSLATIKNLRFDANLKKWIWASNICRKNVLKNTVARLIGAYYRFQMPRYKYAINIVGNGFKNRKYEGFFQSRWIRERVRLAQEYFLISTNFGPYNDPRWKSDFEGIFSEMRDVCFRDKSSFELFRMIPSVRYAPDAVLSMGKQAHENSRNTVIISVIDCLMLERGPELNQSAQRYETLMAKCSDFYAQQGKAVVLLNSNTVQDQSAAVRILENCRNKQNIRIFNYDGNLEKVMELYSRAEKVIATRLHTIILAWLFDVPVIPIVYDIKVDGILQSYGFGDAQYDIRKLGALSPQQLEWDFLKYDYEVPDELIKQANEQFSVLDTVL